MSILALVGYIELTKGQRALIDWYDLEWLSLHNGISKKALGERDMLPVLI